MGWIGAIIGGICGSARGGLIGGILGSLAGDWAQTKLFGGKRSLSGFGTGPSYAGRPDGQRAQIFCASAAAMLAKLAKADGRVQPSEIEAVENAFARLGFDANARAYAIRVFRRAKDDRHTIYEYAVEFRSVVTSVEVREIFYEILWDLACADGFVSAGETDILRRIPAALGIRAEWFEVFRAERLRAESGPNRRGRGSRKDRAPSDPLAEAYATLGISASASDEDAKRAYRELAKKNHPDALRAQGLPEAMIAKANEKMGRINAAWKEVKEARGI